MPFIPMSDTKKQKLNKPIKTTDMRVEGDQIVVQGARFKRTVLPSAALGAPKPETPEEQADAEILEAFAKENENDNPNN